MRGLSMFRAKVVLSILGLGLFACAEDGDERVALPSAGGAPAPPGALDPPDRAPAPPRIDTSPARPPPAAPLEVSLVAVGDSLTYGQASTSRGGETSYPAVLGNLLKVPVRNLGVPSDSSKDLPDVDYLLVPSKQNRLVVMIGTNDIHGGAHANAAETFGRLASYVAAREAAGWLVTVNTPPQWLAATRASDPVAMEYEAMIRAGFSHVADVAASPFIGRGSPSGPDPAYYGDEIGHLNDAGYALLAQIVKSSPAPTGGAPTITPSMGVTRDATLTGWFRDWVQCSVIAYEPERPAHWLNMAETGIFTGDFDAFGQNRPSRVIGAIHGRTAMRFNGPGAGFYLPNDRLTGHSITASEFVISVVMNVENVYGSSSLPYDNDGILSDSGTRLGLSVRQPNIVTAFTYDGATWAHRDGALSIGTPVVVSMRLLGGKLGLRVGTKAAWSETPAGNIDKLSGVLRIGTDSTNQKTFSGLVADVVIRKAYSPATMASDDAYFRARYGVE